jgi:hypothetical protein
VGVATVALAMSVLVGPARAGVLEYCPGHQGFYTAPGDRCKGTERHTFNDNWVYHGPPGSFYVCGYFINPSTGSWINYFCGKTVNYGLYQYYRDNTGVWLDVYSSNRSDAYLQFKSNAAY